MKSILILMFISMLAQAGDNRVYIRDANKISGPDHGTITANGKSGPVLIYIYGKDSIAAAQMYGRGLALNHYPFLQCKQMIIDRATELYAGKAQMIRWFEQDAAAAYDMEIQREKEGTF